VEGRVVGNFEEGTSVDAVGLEADGAIVLGLNDVVGRTVLRVGALEVAVGRLVVGD